jgi:FkbM family methyltransferase
VSRLGFLTREFLAASIDGLTGGRGLPRRVGGEWIRFPPRWLLYYEADYEPATFSFLRQCCGEGHTALDVGAHIGLFSVVIARLVGPNGRVYAFEPTLRTRNVLTRMVGLNGCRDRVEVRPEAVSLETGTASFFDTGEAFANANSLIETHRHGHSHVVDTVSIDDFAFTMGRRVNCIKIDVEGAEFLVLRGAGRVLEAHRPFVSLALHPEALRRGGTCLADVWDLLAAHGMTLTYRGAAVGRDWFCQQNDLFDVQCSPTRL